jgi:hypothetical protein
MARNQLSTGVFPLLGGEMGCRDDVSAHKFPRFFPTLLSGSSTAEALEAIAAQSRLGGFQSL